MENHSNVELLKKVFKLPISYNEEKTVLSSNIISELEILKIQDKEQAITHATDATDVKEETKCVSVYSHVFRPTTTFGEQVMELASEHFTTDVMFLKETQEMITNMAACGTEPAVLSLRMKQIVDQWHEIKGETGFCEKYLYVQWDFAKFLNNNPQFLQFMSIYNIASPLVSLFIPIFILVVPFFIIKLQGLSITMPQYIAILKMLIANHALAKVFTSFHQVDTTQKIYLLVSAAFYIFSIYQNILICIRFYTNMKKIDDYLANFRQYLAHTVEEMDIHLLAINRFTKYSGFANDLIIKRRVLAEIKSRLDCFTTGMKSFFQIGDKMHCFYQLYDNNIYNDAFLYSFGFHGYLDILRGLKQNIDSKKIGFAQFVSNDDQQATTTTTTPTTTITKEKEHDDPTDGAEAKSKCEFSNIYYPPLMDGSPVRNNCKLSKKRNMIITGPNASGKTTLLKSILLNTILTQQFGCGTYDSCSLTPFKHINCYINIPDTNSRDSLFQAEARRCKEIIDKINVKTSKMVRHLCVFDELYSGTNPEEAVTSAKAFMEYLTKYENVTTVLTTHYIDLCKDLDTNPTVQNNYMNTVEKDGGGFDYTYSMAKGISEVKGGLKVLSDMNYPQEILEKTSRPLPKKKKRVDKKETKKKGDKVNFNNSAR